MPAVDQQHMIAEIESLVDALSDPRDKGARIKKAKDRLLVAAQHAAPADRNEAVRRLSTFILLDDPKRAGLAAIVCGALVEYGADPAPMEEPLLARFLPALRKMAEEPVPELTQDTEPVPVEPPQKSQRIKRQKAPGLFTTLWRLLTATHRLRRAIKRQQREAAARPVTENEEIVNALLTPVIAMFSASPSLRSAHPEVRDLVKSLCNRVDGCGYLQTVFDVLEKPETRNTAIRAPLVSQASRRLPGPESARVVTAITRPPRLRELRRQILPRREKQEQTLAVHRLR